jgi:hypothetical protein
VCGNARDAIVGRMLYSRRVAIAASLWALALLPLGAQAASPSPEPVSLRHAPAPVGGLWCGAGLLTGFTLDIAQQSRQIDARLIRKGRVREITGHMEGAMLRTDPQRDQTMELIAAGNELRIVDATGKLALTKGQFFTRAAGGSCSN